MSVSAARVPRTAVESVPGKPQDRPRGHRSKRVCRRAPRRTDGSRPEGRPVRQTHRGLTRKGGLHHQGKVSTGYQAQNAFLRRGSHHLPKERGQHEQPCVRPRFQEPVPQRDEGHQPGRGHAYERGHGHEGGVSAAGAARGAVPKGGRPRVGARVRSRVSH